MEEGRGKRRAASLNGHRDASRFPASVLLHDGTPWGVTVRGRLMQPSEQGAANTVFHNKSIPRREEVQSPAASHVSVTTRSLIP